MSFSFRASLVRRKIQPRIRSRTCRRRLSISNLEDSCRIVPLCSTSFLMSLLCVQHPTRIEIDQVNYLYFRKCAIQSIGRIHLLPHLSKRTVMAQYSSQTGTQASARRRMKARKSRVKPIESDHNLLSTCKQSPE